MFDEIVEAILTVGNTKQVKEQCEPNIMARLKLEKWMVERVLYTIGLIYKVAEESQNAKNRRN